MSGIPSVSSIGEVRVLKVGVVLDSTQPPAWIAYVLEQVHARRLGNIELVILDAPEAPQRSLSTRLKGCWSDALYAYYEVWDYQRNKAPWDYREPTDLSQWLKGIPLRRVTAVRQGSAEVLGDADVAAIRQANLDVILQLGGRILRGEFLGSARFGVWRCHHGDDLAYRGGPPLFWEIADGNPVSGSVLEILSDRQEGDRVIYRGYAATRQRSLYLNRNPIYWKTAEFMLRRLADLNARGADNLPDLAAGGDTQVVAPTRRGTPHAAQMLAFLAGQFFRAVRDSLVSRSLGSQPQWFLALRRRSPAWGFKDAQGYRQLPTPPDGFRADPMLFTKDGKTWLFLRNYGTANPGDSYAPAN
jgi:hypothetical protein